MEVTAWSPMGYRGRWAGGRGEPGPEPDLLSQVGLLRHSRSP
jgi:hypothetical protein